MEKETIDNFRETAGELFRSGVEYTHIEDQLKKDGADENTIAIIIKELKELNFLRRKKRGFKLVFAGSFLLVFGFVITLILFNTSNSIHYAMYSLTTTGIILLLWGMVDLMGW